MSTEQRRLRDRAAQRALITTTARTLAEREGWDAVTTRRLSAEIEYSQPVIYKHFASLDEIVEAVALEGFGDLAEALAHARETAAGRDALTIIASAYDAWAVENPSLYDAMFTRATRLRFAADDTPAALSAAYRELRAAVAATSDEDDTDTATEVLWAALHGLVTLGRGGRLRPDQHAERIELLVARLGA
jgi:AcrR family transcriptional regulator